MTDLTKAIIKLMDKYNGINESTISSKLESELEMTPSPVDFNDAMKIVYLEGRRADNKALVGKMSRVHREVMDSLTRDLRKGMIAPKRYAEMVLKSSETLASVIDVIESEGKKSEPVN